MADGGVGEDVEDALFLQARGVLGAEFEEWVGKLTSVLQSTDRGPLCLTLLRQFFVLTAATKYRRNFSSDVYKLLLSIVVEPEQGPLKIRLISATILQELSPSKHIEVSSFSPPLERSNIPLLLPVLLAQTNARDKLSKLAPTLVQWLSLPGQEEEISFAALCALSALCTHPRALEQLEAEQYLATSQQLAVWLKQASTNSLPAPTTGISIFGGAGKKQLVPVKEIDGNPSQGIFTILNLGGYYSTDQLLNVAAFSVLRRWLLATLATGGGGASGLSPSGAGSVSATPTLELTNQGSHSSLTPVPGTSSLTISHPSPLLSSLGGGSFGPASLTASLTALGAGGKSKQGLKEAAFQYCLRVIEQCERKPVKGDDSQLIDSCLYECVSTLDLLCSLSTSMVHTVFPKMRILYNRVTQDPVTNARLLLILLKFFVNHGESEMYDLDGLMELFFGKVLAVSFNDPALAYEVVAYLVDNLERLHATTNIFIKFFPNILKILAWFPVTFVAEFLQLLPAFINKNSATEVLHSLLDLPSLSATLQAQYLLTMNSDPSDFSPYPQYAKCLAAFQDSTFKLMFGHFLRSENGKGDTIDRLGSLHHLLLDFVDHQRVKVSSQVAPLMIDVFFRTVLSSGEGKVTMQLAVVLLERIIMLYDLEPFAGKVRELIAKQLLLMFRRHPELVVDQQRELMDYLGNLRTLATGGELCYMHLVWLVGEYSHSGYDARCSTALLNQFFGTVESVALEISISFDKGGATSSIRLVMVLMSTLAKLASRCQELIPRALLCLNKIVQFVSDNARNKETNQILLNRANELVNVLKMPSLASAVLSPPAVAAAGSSPSSSFSSDSSRQTNLAHLLQVTSNHFKTPSVT